MTPSAPKFLNKGGGGGGGVEKEKKGKQSLKREITLFI